MNQLEQHIQVQMQAAQIPGLAIAVIENAEIAYSGGFGVCSTTTREAVTADTVFQMASLSKPLFTFGVLKLVEQGLIALDRPLSQYLPQPYITHDDRIHLITARNILSHTPGFPNWRPERDWNKGHFDNVPLPIEADPGSRFSYSGEGFWYLQYVIEHRTGQALDSLMQAHVFTPLAMRHSSYVWQGRFENMVADGHKENGDTIERDRMTEANTAFSLYSSAADYAQIITALLNRADILDQMRQPQVPVGDQRDLSWGLGLGIQHGSDGSATLWHWGANPGFRNFVVINPDKRSAVIILTNSDNGLNICESIVQAALNNDIPLPAFKWLLPQNHWRADGTITA